MKKYGSEKNQCEDWPWRFKQYSYYYYYYVSMSVFFLLNTDHGVGLVLLMIYWLLFDVWNVESRRTEYLV